MSAFSSVSLSLSVSYAYALLCVCVFVYICFVVVFLFFFYLSISFAPHISLEKTLSGLKPCVCIAASPYRHPPPYHTIVWYLSIETPKKYLLTLYIELNTLNDDKRREIRKQTRHRLTLNARGALEGEQKENNPTSQGVDAHSSQSRIVGKWMRDCYLLMFVI